MREFIQMFEHSTRRMHQMLYGAVTDPDRDEGFRIIMDMFNLVYLASTYALVSAWIDDKQDENSLRITINLTTGEEKWEGTFTEMRVPRRYRASTNRL